MWVVTVIVGKLRNLFTSGSSAGSVGTDGKINMNNLSWMGIL